MLSPNDNPITFHLPIIDVSVYPPCAASFSWHLWAVARITHSSRCWQKITSSNPLLQIEQNMQTCSLESTALEQPWISRRCSLKLCTHFCTLPQNTQGIDHLRWILLQWAANEHWYPDVYLHAGHFILFVNVMACSASSGKYWSGNLRPWKTQSVFDLVQFVHG